MSYLLILLSLFSRELNVLAHHYHPSVRQFAESLLSPAAKVSVRCAEILSVSMGKQGGREGGREGRGVISGGVGTGNEWREEC